MGSAQLVTIIAKDTTTLRIKIKMRCKMYEAATIPPPNVGYGIDVTFFSLNNSESSIHSNLICAVSPYVRREVAKMSTQDLRSIKLTSTRIEVFDVLSRWLYCGQIPAEKPSDSKADEFWASVFLMSRKLEVTDLQAIAFAKFEACFSLNIAPSSGWRDAFSPSTELLKLIFEPANPQDDVLQSWIVGHFYWVYKCMPSALNGTAQLIEPYTILTSKLCTKLVTNREQRDAYFSRIKPEHPKEDALWASSHGLNSRMLRSAAEALLTPDANVPQIFDSNHQPAETNGVTRERVETAFNFDFGNNGHVKTELGRQYTPRASSVTSERTEFDDPQDPPDVETEDRRRTSARSQRNKKRVPYDAREYYRGKF